MGYDRKYGKVTTEHGSVPDDEPVIVFRARDLFTVPAINAYLEACRDGGSPELHLGLVQGTLDQFRAWQREHPDRVRVPDSAAHGERLRGQEQRRA